MKGARQARPFATRRRPVGKALIPLRRRWTWRDQAACVLLAALSWQTLATELFVDLTSATPTPPYTNWTTAARNIQDALEQ
jgi:hypothetical protein